ncbi:MAG TPA: xylose operon transcription regulator XylR, partial [Isosphaeraceae bacterium]
MAGIPHVALMIETSSIYGRRLLEGITRYVRSHRPWSIFLEQRELDSQPPRWLETWRGDGVISRCSSPDVAAALRGAGVAAVDLCDRWGSFGLARITSDDPAIGTLAAEHLRERGFRSFGFCGFADELWVVRRREGFLQALARTGGTERVYESHW